MCPSQIGNRTINVTITEQKDCSKSFLRILANGDVENYIASLLKDCTKNETPKIATG